MQFVRGLGAEPQRFWLCLEPKEKEREVVEDELITLSAAGHYNSGQVSYNVYEPQLQCTLHTDIQDRSEPFCKFSVYQIQHFFSGHAWTWPC